VIRATTPVVWSICLSRGYFNRLRPDGGRVQVGGILIALGSAGDEATG
jgi:hypothetical protein